MTLMKEHWNDIFESTEDASLGWYEEDVTQTLKFVDEAEPGEQAVIFLPGAGTTLLADELMARGHTLILNDISDKALTKLRERMGDGPQRHWLCHDLAEPLPGHLPPADLWVDRAVLHFLTDEAAIQTYFDNLKGAVKPGGHALLAEFSKSGARKCAGLQLHRYSAEELRARMSPDFQLLRQEPYTYTNPWGDPRPYIYTLFRKSGG